MPHVSPDTVRQVARLARLSLTPEETRTFASQLERILSFAERIQALDTAGVEAMVHPGSGAGLREDTPVPSLPRERALEQAPDAADGLFRVPRVIG
jgi:aspartyl-tRNA(Asn)/glutamyl-tRNA(Gln) amidotransferase subunit C